MTRLIRNCLLTVFCLLCVVRQELWAQLDNLRFEYITIQNGLPHNRINAILQDKNGFMWFGSQDGLVRYDGYECRIYKQQQSNAVGFRGKNVECLLEDQLGNLWVGMQSGGINIREARTGHFYNISQSETFKPIADSWIRVILEDKKGRIWVGTVGKGLIIYDPQTKQAQHFDTRNSDLKDNTVSAIIEDTEGVVWLSSAGTYIYRFEPSSGRFLPISFAPTNKYIDFRKTLHLDGLGNLWIGTQDLGLFRYTPSTQQIQSFVRQKDAKGLSSNNVLDIAQGKNNLLLIATDGGGLNMYDPTSETFKVLTYTSQNQGALNSNALYSLFVDKDENIWIGTINGGVNVYKAHKTRFDNFTHIGNRKGELTHRSVIAIRQSSNGKIWVGTDGGGLNRFDRRSNVFTKINNATAQYSLINNENVVRAIFEDSKKRLWLGYFNDGLDLFDADNERTIKRFRFAANDPLSISSNNVWSFAEDKDGRIWVATERNGLNVFRPEDGRFTRFLHNPDDTTSLSSNDIVAILIDRNNNLWIGTESKGLNLYNRSTNTFTHYKHNENTPLSISADDVRSLYEDRKGRLWIGTESGGLDVFENGQFRHFSTQNGLNSNAIMGIMEDKNGLIWLSTFKGISCFNPDMRSVLNYDFNQKDNNNQFSSMVAMQAQNGELYFGGINGLTIINPDWVHSHNVKPKVIFTDFKIFNQSISAGENLNGKIYLSQALEQASEIAIPYADNAFSFEFSSLDFTEPYKNQYAYKMDGFDRDWRFATSEQRTVTYTNLDPGTYTFRVKGTNSNGTWGEETSIKVCITPPFWMTWWFKLLLVLLLAGLAWLTFRIYLERREMALQQKVWASESEILKLQNDMLETEVATKNNELMSKAVQMAHKNEILIGFKEQLDDVRSASDAEKARLLRGLKSKIETEIQGEESWAQFNLYFDQVNQNFTSELLKKHPNLTQNDLRICALTRLNLSTKEIAALLNISAKGVQQSRYRVKKRMELTEDDDLYEYLRGV
ncbi:MAG: hypothetical protein JNL70_09320 [Saprospiraceae bacterium]|nr:hypothetical protein [Saprospiraceae bacterium]